MVYDPDETVDELEYGAVNRQKTGSFLKTLTVLTFVGSFFSILSAVVWMAGIYIADTWRPPQAGSATFTWAGLDPYAKALIIYNFVLLITSLLCTIGAAIMLKRLAAGFWIYIAGQATHLIALLIMIICTFEQNIKPLAVLHVFHFLVCVAFFAMYWVNKKHLGTLKIMHKKIRGRSKIKDIY